MTSSRLAEMIKAQVNASCMEEVLQADSSRIDFDALARALHRDASQCRRHWQALTSSQDPCRAFERACFQRIVNDAATEGESRDETEATVYFLPGKSRVRRSTWRALLCAILTQPATSLHQVDFARAIARVAKMETGICEDEDYWKRKLHMFLQRHQVVVDGKKLGFRGLFLTH